MQPNQYKTSVQKHDISKLDVHEGENEFEKSLILFANTNFESEVTLCSCVWEVARQLAFDEEEDLMSHSLFIETHTIDHLISIVQSDLTLTTKCGGITALGYILKKMAEPDNEKLVEHEVTGQIINLFLTAEPTEPNLHHIIDFMANAMLPSQRTRDMILSFCPLPMMLDRARDLQNLGRSTQRNFASLIQLISVIPYFELSDEDSQLLLEFAVDMFRHSMSFSAQTMEWLVQTVTYLVTNCNKAEMVAECKDWIDICVILMRDGTYKIAKRVVNFLNCLFHVVSGFTCDCYDILIEDLNSDVPELSRDCARLIKVIIETDSATFDLFIGGRITKALLRCFTDATFEHKMVALRLMRFLCRQNHMEFMKQCVKEGIYQNLPWSCVEDCVVGELLVEISEYLFEAMSVLSPAVLVRLKSQFESCNAGEAMREIDDEDIRARVVSLLEMIDAIDVDEILNTEDLCSSSSDTEIREC